MSSEQRLTSEERRFFLLVSQAAFLNPFADERAEADLRILGLVADENWFRHKGVFAQFKQLDDLQLHRGRLNRVQIREIQALPNIKRSRFFTQ